MGGGGGKGKQSYVSGYRYYAGLQLAFCQFADKVLRIDVGDKTAWTGSVSSNSAIYINQPELFGGEGREGGIVGEVDFCFGSPSQDKNAYLMSVLGTSIIPAYRGLLTLVCKKVMLAANNPYIKEWSVMAQRTQTGWRTDYANIASSDGYVDMNPAHIIREVLTNHYWGTLGYPESDIDETSFFDTALTLWNEGFGLSLLWGTNSGVNEFIKVVLDHIDAVLYVSHVTGKVKLKLIRNDYIIGNLPVMDDSNIVELVDFNTPSSPEMVNQVVLTYVDRENKAKGITVQDVAGINRCSGQINSMTIHMPGVSTDQWAAKLASRELQQVAVPISTATMIVTRKNFMLEEGDCFEFNRPSIGVEGMVMRIVSVEIGTIDDSPLRITAVRDAYNLGAIAFVTPQTTNWTIPKNPPAPAIRRKLFEMNWWQFVVDTFGDSAAVLAEIDNTSTFVCTVCGQPSYDAMNYQTWSRNIGAPDFIYRDTDSFPFIATLAVSVPPEVQSTLTLSVDYLDTNMVKVGAYAMLEDEWISVISRDPVSKTVVVARGIFDTIPVSHPAGAYLWFHQGLFGFDGTERVAGEQVEVKFLPATGIGRLAIGSAPSDTITLTGRMMRPYPPGNVKLNAQRWPPTIPSATELDITWAHRDRITQTVTHNKQDEGNIGPEVGTTYNLKIYGDGNVLRRTVTSITGTSYKYLAVDELADKGFSFASDPYWANVVLAMPLDGTHGSTNFIELKGNSATSTTCTISTAQSKFGGSSAYVSAGRINIPTSPSFNFADLDFTVEMYAYFLTNGRNVNYDGILFQIGHSYLPGGLKITSSYPNSPAKLKVQGYASGIVDIIPDGVGTVSDDTWHHIALTKQGDVYRLFLDGALYSTATSTYVHAQGEVSVGCGSPCFYGYLDSVRVTKGTCRYTTTFTPPGAMCNLITDLNSALRVELESSRDSMLSLNKWDVTTTRS
jgi:hypothetical protein